MALIYYLLGPLLLLIETKVYGGDAIRQALPITILATFFFTYNLVSLIIFNKLHRSGSKSIPTYYLASKLLRLLLSMMIFTCYGLLINNDMLLFAINLVAFYFVSIITNSIYCIREEKIKKNK